MAPTTPPSPSARNPALALAESAPASLRDEGSEASSRPMAVLDMGASALRLVVAEKPPGEPLRVLEEAGLVLSQKRGRVRELHFNSVPIQLIHDRWTTEYGRFWASQVTELKLKVESRRRRKPK